MAETVKHIEGVFEIKNEMGLHARPASLLVRCAADFESEIHIEKDGEQVPCDSVMSLLLLAAGRGSEVKIMVEGTDADEAFSAVGTLFANNFGE